MPIWNRAAVICTRKGDLCYRYARQPGTWASHRDGGHTQVPSIAIKSVDSTGAGDAFVGALMFRFMQRNTRPIAYNDFITDVVWANRVGALTCTRFGAIDAIPSLAELD